ncbi:hypothetical protein GCM10023149_08680 [Mucilaginibacter gynuensis]|uniref:Uncharacterized protein n=1 Tax=Mucilaginibacter gynuensis TaxID=1302236 RepID=A0ABP8FXR3_9SPHI
MITEEKYKAHYDDVPEQPQDVNNNHGDPDDDQSNSEPGEHDLAKGNQPTEQKKDDDERIHTVTPDNDSGDPGPPVEERSASATTASNKDAGPKGENL